MSDPPKRSRRVPKPGPQAQLRGGRPVDEATIREIFKQANILEREAKGELTTRISYDAPAPLRTIVPRGSFPVGTRSRRQQYFDRAGAKIAEAHYYLLPDNRIGASGLPDPKEVVHEGILYYLKR
jgi:hypothetical protein